MVNIQHWSATIKVFLLCVKTCRTMDIRFLMFVIIIFLRLLFSRLSCATDIISLSTNLSDGRTLVSSDGSFELGFFSPGSSAKNRYLGIWFKKVSVGTVVWVANRCNPINDSSGLLMINSTGNLVLVSQNRSVVWASNSKKEAQNPVVQLLNSGNLVLRDGIAGKSEIILWQSFDYPTDTLLAGMKLGWDLRIGLNRQISAWKSPDDPCPGDLTYGIELYNYPEFVMWKGSKKYSRPGNWDGIGFSGLPLPEPEPDPFYGFNVISNEEEIYFIYYLKTESVISRIVFNQTWRRLQHTIWNEEAKTWTVYSQFPNDDCDNFGTCGAYETCLNAVPPCQCLKGFKQKSLEWNSMEWSHQSQGCVRNNFLDCEGDGFIKFGGLKPPDTTDSWVNRSMDLSDCKAKCLENCSCMAYTTLDIKENKGCAIWFGDLLDLKKVQFARQDLYIRVSAADSDHEKKKDKAKMKAGLIIASTILVVIGVLVITYYICWSHRSMEGREYSRNDEMQNEDVELPLFELDVISKATNNFSLSNKLGEGGFGAVYKGTLSNGKEIAVKRLSRSSRQGFVEFKNEVALITKLQHRNLVKLQGYCIHGEEKMLIYEYLPNKSLDFFIFDDTRRRLLEWSRRFHIICGIARGLNYLHQDSRLRIIHRDLKVSNVLLDSEMNPKISDFGMARSFGEQSEGNTRRVVGTYGYMAPEYAIFGKFSVKSDVFSFGVLLLEIVSGKKNREFNHLNHSLGLIEHAWRLWKEGHPSELIDSFVLESCNLSEVLRCIHISLLCVQQHPKDRPRMSSVVLMLGSDTALEQPKEPGFLFDNNSLETNSSSNKPESPPTNELSLSVLEPR